MKQILDRLDKLLDELAGQQLKPDDWWRPEWASIKEALMDREFERRVMQDRRHDERAA